MKRFKLGDRLYNMSTNDEVSLRDIVLFNKQAAELGIDERWADIEEAIKEMRGLDKDAAFRHPAKNLIIAVTIWASRRVAGDDVTFEQAIDFPMKDLTFLPDTEDNKAGKARKRTSSPRASGQGASKRAPAARKPRQPAT